MLHFFLSILREKPWIVHLLPIVSSPAGHSKLYPLLFVLSISQASRQYQFHHLSIWGETETSPSGSSWKSWDTGCMFRPSFSFQGRSSESRLVLSCAVLGKELMEGKMNLIFLSISVQLSLALCSPGVCNFLTEFWNSHKCLLVHISLLNWHICGGTKAEASWLQNNSYLIMPASVWKSPMVWFSHGRLKAENTLYIHPLC